MIENVNEKKNGGPNGWQVPTGIEEAVVALLKPYIPALTERRLQDAIMASQPREQEDGILRKPLTRKKAAELLSVSLNTLNRYLNEGKLKRVYLSDHAVRVDEKSIREFLTKGN